MIDLSRCALHPGITFFAAASADGDAAPTGRTGKTSRALRAGRVYRTGMALHKAQGEGFLIRAMGKCRKKYAGSKGLMPQDLKLLGMFCGVTSFTKAFVHNSKKEAGPDALPSHSLCSSLLKRVKAVFRAPKAVSSSGCMTSVKWVQEYNPKSKFFAFSYI